MLGLHNFYDKTCGQEICKSFSQQTRPLSKSIEKAVSEQSGECKVVIFWRVWSFYSYTLYILSADNSGQLFWDSIEVAQSRRRTKCTKHASKKIRPSKRLEPYILRKTCNSILWLRRPATVFGTEKPWQPETWQESKLFSLPGNRAIFSTFWGDFLTKLHSKPGEKGKDSTGENSTKNPVETAPRSCRWICPLSWSNASWSIEKPRDPQNSTKIGKMANPSAVGVKNVC